MATTTLGYFDLVNAPYPDYAVGNPDGPIGVHALTQQIEDKIATLLPGGGAGTGDFSSNTSTSVDGEFVVFSGTAGKTGKRFTGTGLVKATSGVGSIATAGTDYLAPAGNGSGLTALNASALASGTVPAARFPALTGDVTTSAGSVATTIGASKVVNSMIANGTIDLGTKVTGTLPDAQFPATLPTINGVHITDLDASNIANGTLGDTFLSGNVPLLNATNNFTATETITKAGIGATSTDALLLRNTTAAANAAQQWSPRLHWQGQAWKSNATAASQTIDFIAELQAIQNPNPADGALVFSSQVAGAGYTERLRLSVGGDLTVYSIHADTVVAASEITVGGNGVLTDASLIPIAGGGTGQTTAANAINALLPSQTSNSGKYLTTNGTAASWGTVATLTNSAGSNVIPKSNGTNFVASSITDTGSVVTVGAGVTNISGTLNVTAGELHVLDLVQFERDGIGTTPTDGLVIANTTAAAAGAQQWSPRLHFQGQGWKTTATAASRSVDFVMEVQPIQGVSQPFGTLVFSSKIGSGSYTQILSLDSDGGLVVPIGASINHLDLTDALEINSGGTGQSTAVGAINALLPTQTGNSGKFLTTNGTVASWGSAGAGDALTTQPLSQFAATTSAQLAGVLSDESGSSGGFVRSGGGLLSGLTGLGIRSTGAAFDLTIATSEVLTAGRTLSIVLNDAARTLTISGSATLSGTNTGDQTTVSGNAGTATALQTARAINGVSFDGTAAITVAAAAGTLTGATLASGVTASSLTSLGTIASLVATTAAISGGSHTGLTSLGIRDTSAAFDVTLAATSSTTLTAGRTLTLDLTNAARTLKLTGNPTLADWFDQSVKTTASVTHAGITGTGVLIMGSGPTTITGADGKVLSAALNTVAIAQGGTGTTTSTGSGSVVLNSSPTFAGTPVFPTSAGTAQYAMDFSGGTQLTIANNATATPFGAGDFTGFCVINDPSVTGTSAAFITGATVVKLGESGAGTNWSTTAGTAGKINVYVNGGGALEIQNKNGSSISFRVFGMRMR